MGQICWYVILKNLCIKVENLIGAPVLTNESTNEIDEILKTLCNSNPSNLKFCYLNVNSIRNKFSDLQKIVNGNVDIVSIAETKLDGSFPSAQFFWEGYKAPYRLDVNSRSGGLLLYVKSSIPSRLLQYKLFL